VYRTRDRATVHVHITVVDLYAQPFGHRSDELVPTAIPDLLVVPLTGREPTW
jgi:hypothetical protein